MIAKLYRSNKKGSCAWRRPAVWCAGWCLLYLCRCMRFYCIGYILSNKSFLANQFCLMRDVGYLTYIQHSMLVIHTSSRSFRAFWCSLYLFSWWILTLWWPNELTWSGGGRVSYYQTRQSCPASNYMRVLSFWSAPGKRNKNRARTHESQKELGPANLSCITMPAECLRIFRWVIFS